MMRVAARRHARRPLRWSVRGRALLVLCATLLPFVGVAGAGARDTAAVPITVDPFADVVPVALPAAERAADRLSAYRMDVALDPVAGTIGGQMTLTWCNPASRPLAEVWFRLFPNAEYYAEGNLAVADVTVDGTTVTPELALDQTALRVPLAQPVAPGERVEIALTFTTTVPADSSGSFGIFSHETQNGTWVLADWYPVLAVWEEGSGWALPPVTSFGDPTYAPSAFYDVRIATPPGLKVMATGVAVEETQGEGTISRRFLAGPARDFAIVADDDETARGRQIDETRVTLWTAPNIDPDASAQTLDVAAEALRFYNERFGPYPTREVDLVQTDPSGALGIAWSGLLFLDGPALLATYGESDPDGLATIVAHEVGHLWWGILIGGDSNKHPYIQEGLATVSSLLFVQETLGAEAARAQFEAWVTRPARSLLDEGDAVVDVPNSEGDNEAIRSHAIYGKGSLGFLAIRQEIGAAAFAAGLRDAATRYAWREMTPEQLRQAFERASGQDLAPLWHRWFDEAAMTSEEIDAIAAAFGRDGTDEVNG